MTGEDTEAGTGVLGVLNQVGVRPGQIASPDPNRIENERAINGIGRTPLSSTPPPPPHGKGHFFVFNSTIAIAIASKVRSLIGWLKGEITIRSGYQR